VGHRHCGACAASSQITRFWSADLDRCGLWRSHTGPFTQPRSDGASFGAVRVERTRRAAHYAVDLGSRPRSLTMVHKPTASGLFAPPVAGFSFGPTLRARQQRKRDQCSSFALLASVVRMLRARLDVPSIPSARHSLLRAPLRRGFSCEFPGLSGRLVSDRIMGKFIISGWLPWLGWASTLAMAACVIGMIVSWFG
jgi:hypothetical protein